MSRDVVDFETEVLKRSHTIPVLVDFWAEWCGPCKVLTPVLEHLWSQTGKENWELAKVNVEDHPELARDYRIQGIPAVKLFRDGDVVAEFVGALPEARVADWLRKYIPGKHGKLLSTAVDLIESGQTAEGRSMLEELIREDPQNVGARIQLARTILFTDRPEASELIRGLEEPLPELAQSLTTILRLLDLGEHPEPLPGAPTRNAYLEAIGFLASRRFAEALAGFIEIIRNDRYYDDDGSRKACIAIFKYLGEDHPITQEFRRPFGSALYV